MKLKTIIFLFLLSCQVVYAQNIPGSTSLKGIVLDSVSLKPIASATVKLLGNTGNKVLEYASDLNGNFNIPEVKMSQRLQVSAIGYTGSTINIPSSKRRRTFNSVIIYLRPSIVQLKDVNIKLSHSNIIQEVDRIIYNVKADAERESLSTLDIMRKVPLLAVDADGHIRFRSSRNFKILVNGRESGLFSNNPSDALKAFPAANVERIEVITTPPVKYDAEGLAGIINIITNRNQSDGYNGRLSVTGKYPVGKPGSASGSLNIKSKQIGFENYIGSIDYKMPASVSSLERSVHGPDQASNLSQNTRQPWQNGFFYWSSSLSYNIDSMNLITASIDINDGEYKAFENQSSLNLSGADEQEGYSLTGNTTNPWNTKSVNVDYEKSFKNDKKKSLVASYRFDHEHDITSTHLDFEENVNYKINALLQRNTSGSDTHSFQIDYTQSVHQLTMEIGAKANLRRNSINDDNTIGLVSQPSSEADTLTGNLENTQDVFSVYNSYGYNCKSFSINGGLRLEGTYIHSENRGLQDFSNHYLNLAPSLAVKRTLKNGTNINIGFSRRLARPSVYDLNPFINYSNPYVRALGNPSLKPATTNRAEISCSKYSNFSFSLGMTYSGTRGGIQKVSYWDNKQDVLVTQSANVGKLDNVGANIFISGAPLKPMELSLNGTLSYITAKGFIEQSWYSNNGFQESLAVTARYSFLHDWSSGLTINYNSPYISFMNKSSSNFYYAASVSKLLMSKKFSLSASLINPSAKYRDFLYKTWNPDFNQKIIRRDYYRSYSLSLSYRFGHLNSQIRKSRASIQNSDVSGKHT